MVKAILPPPPTLPGEWTVASATAGLVCARMPETGSLSVELPAQRALTAGQCVLRGVDEGTTTMTFAFPPIGRP